MKKLSNSIIYTVLMWAFASACVHAQSTAENESITSEQIWVDRWQQNITNTFNFQAQAIDQWFIDAPTQSSQAGASGKIRLGWEPRSRNFGEFDTRFKIKFSLPSLTNKVDLLLSDDDDGTLDNSVKASREIDNRQQSTTLALRFYSPRLCLLPCWIWSARSSLCPSHVSRFV